MVESNVVIVTINLCMLQCTFKTFPAIHVESHLTRHRIMLIDLYERPNSPEAAKSRAFIDKIFSISGPDGGVVGGEDGITTQRPLKDGGREAWDMMRRLREKAWQKAGLDPHQLWTEQAQIQAGVAPLPGHEPRGTPFVDRNNTVMKDVQEASNAQPLEPRVDTRRPIIVDRQLTDFSRQFFNMTRAHMLQNPVVSLQPPPRFSYQLPPPAPTSAPRTPQTLPPTPHVQQFSVPHAVLNPRLDSTLASSVVSSPESMAATHTTDPLNHLANVAIASPSSSASFMETTTVTNPPLTMTTGPSTPPSMMDPNLNFDWDQWDAVFGQHLPVADEFMELDPVGFGFPDLGGMSSNVGSQGQPSRNGSFAGSTGDPGMMGAMGSWADFG